MLGRFGKPSGLINQTAKKMAKQIRFYRFRNNPIIPRTPGTFFSIHSANPDFLKFENKYFLYFRGQDESGHDQIGAAFTTPDKFDGIHWEFYRENPVVKVSKNSKDFDSGYVLDPASIVIKGKVYLYYSGHRSDWNDWNIPSYIGLAFSEDGFHFEKFSRNPTIFGTAPEVICFNGLIYLFFQRKNSQGFFEIFCCPSEDGIHFVENDVKKIFGPSIKKENFDRYSISTVRIWREENWFFMFYGGCNHYFDYPISIGLARSQDLLHWERYPKNPILSRGYPGSWDEGALWFATVHKFGDKYYLWYEGAGTGFGLQTQKAMDASKICRENDYGGYKKIAFSQIGLATFEGDVKKW